MTYNHDLPKRRGLRPRTTPHAPHSQVEQIAEPEQMAFLSQQLAERLSTLSHVKLGWSRRAPPGTVGFFLDAAHACSNERAFLLAYEFAHIHAQDDGSLHVILPEPLRSAAIEKGWSEPHPLAGQPTVSPDTVMIYAPRDMNEVEIVASLVRQSWSNAKR